MLAGGGDQVGDTYDVAYPRSDRRNLGILRDLAKYLEMEPLVGLIERDIIAATAAAAVVKPTVVREEKLCWYCNKAG